MTVGELRREMSTAEFTNWIAFFKLEEEERKAKEVHDRVTGKYRH